METPEIQPKNDSVPRGPWAPDPVLSTTDRDRRLRELKCVVGKRFYLISYLLSYFELVKCFEDRVTRCYLGVLVTA